MPNTGKRSSDGIRLILCEMSIVEQRELWFNGKLKKYCEINPLEVLCIWMSEAIFS